MKKFFLVIALIFIFRLTNLMAKDGVVPNSLKMFTSSNQKIGIKDIVVGTYLSKFCPPEQCLFDAHYANSVYWVYCEIENEHKTPSIFDSHFFL